ncbi:MAG: deoxyribodipyrimidine photo-lyase [Ignavibacteriales bacterium]|nr:deoxyribodipyrimidine photo-lyase [Ignavibacteriales bacterium]
MTDPRRIKILNDRQYLSGSVVYWISRDQRVGDNWAITFAQELALQHLVPLIVVFNLLPEFLGATIRQYDFMLRGFQELENKLRKYEIPFNLLIGSPDKTIPKFISRHKVGILVTDFSPLRISRVWKEQVANSVSIPFYEVDTHNIVPCWNASPKMEYGAYTFRPKIQRLLPEFLDQFPSLKKHPFSLKDVFHLTDWNKAYQSLHVDKSVSIIDWLIPGEKAALKILERFIEKRFKHYEAGRNDPNADVQSDLSPYLHFGQIAAQRVAYEINRFGHPLKSVEAFLEELIVRKELSDNFCFYNPNYDSMKGFPEWSRKSLQQHEKDTRNIIYTKQQFERGGTHDALWNAAQMELVQIGKMHGYMRMYWAKKILEWSKTPADAFATAVYLNDKYELDGRDPNGYAGIAWSIGGTHDRAWGERKIFGKVRYMNQSGCKRKFDTDLYIKKNKNSK